MDNAAFAALVAAKKKKAGPQQQQQQQKMDRGEIRKIVSKDMQREKDTKKTRKRGGNNEHRKKRGDDEEDREARKKSKYRDRAEERRTNSHAAVDEVAVEASMTQFLGGDEEHTHLVRGLDYALLRKVKEKQQQRVEALPEKKTEEPPPQTQTQKRRHDAAVGVARWLEEKETIRKRPCNVRGTSFEYDVVGAPLTITRSRAERRALFDEDAVVVGGGLAAGLLQQVCDALARRGTTKKAVPRPSENFEDIFDGVGGIWDDRRETTQPAAPRDDDEDDGHTASRYFQTTTTTKKVPTASRKASFVVPPAAAVAHRDPIFGGEPQKPRLARNFDGTDSAYDLAATYDSDDEAYSTAKARQLDAKPPRKRGPKKKKTTPQEE